MNLSIHSQSHRNEDRILIIVGTKSDDVHKKVITFEQGKQLVDEYTRSGEFDNLYWGGEISSKQFSFERMTQFFQKLVGLYMSHFDDCRLCVLMKREDENR